MLFGRRREVEWTSPPAAQPNDLRLAQLQHELALLLREQRAAQRTSKDALNPTGLSIRPVEPMPRSTWSDYLSGKQFMPAHVLAATAIAALSQVDTGHARADATEN